MAKKTPRLVRADTYPTFEDFQKANCTGCKFADKPMIGTGRPCCTYAFKLDHSGGICHTKRQE